MPREARFDLPGLLQHVMVRGNERRNIFRDDLDRGAFVKWLGEVCAATSTCCFAWALMSNHVHLLVARSDVPLGTVMRRLLGRYAGYFNRRHGRRGHLFENRYKSIACQEDRYFLELVRYIHLNPADAGLVRTRAQLDRYRWTGHAVLMGNLRAEWQAVDRVLRVFARGKRRARDAYRAFVMERWGQGRDPLLSGGGLVRSFGGRERVRAARTACKAVLGDARILGDPEFVADLLARAERAVGRVARARDVGWNPAQVVAHAARIAGISADAVYGAGKGRAQSRARALACHWLLDDLGERVTDVARLLRIRPSAVRAAADRARRQDRPGRLPAAGPGELEARM